MRKFIAKITNFLPKKQNMILLAGLGNIGKEYEKTRHNFGFLAIDAIIEKFNFSKAVKKFSSEFFSGEINGQKIIALKPQTYMNNSGIAVLEAAKFYKIPPEKIIIFHDEIDIKFGEIRTKQGGGNAGHNGLKSIDNKIGKNYHRFRLGVGRPKHENHEVSDYVLSKFSKDEMLKVEEINQEIASSIADFINKLDS